MATSLCFSNLEFDLFSNPNFLKKFNKKSRFELDGICLKSNPPIY